MARLLVLVLAVLVAGVGCAAKQATPPPRDPPFSKWHVLKEKHKGYSPSPRRRDLVIQERVREAMPVPEPEEAVEPERPLPTTPVTLRLLNTNVETVLRALTRLVEINIVLSDNDGARGGLSLDINEVPWNQTFRGILRTKGLVYRWEGDLLRVMTPEDMENELKLDQIQEKRKAQRIILRRVEPLVSTVIEIDYADAEQLKQNLTSLLTTTEDGKPRGSIQVDKHTNSLLIQAIRDDIMRMLPLIEKLDKPTRQVLIQASIVEANQDVARTLGVQWGGRRRSNIAGGVSLGSDVNPDPTVDGGNQNFMVNFPADASLAANALGTSTLGLVFGNLTKGGNFLQVQLSALQDEGKLRILSSPSITTLDNQTAFTENGEKVPYATLDEAGNTVVRFEDAVLRLEITPHVIGENNLKMRILVRKDDVDFSQGVDGNPLIHKRETQTGLIVENGETIVISGLSRHQRQDASSGVPGFKEVPILGALFKNTSKGNEMEEVLIFITPYILEEKAPADLAESS